MKEEYGCDPMIEIYPYPTLFKLKDFLGGIHHYVTVVGNCSFEINFTFALFITKNELDYYCINNYGTKRMNGCKGVLKAKKKILIGSLGYLH